MFLNHSKWLRIALEASKFHTPSCLGVFAYNSLSFSYAPGGCHCGVHDLYGPHIYLIKNFSLVHTFKYLTVFHTYQVFLAT